MRCLYQMRYRKGISNFSGLATKLEKWENPSPSLTLRALAAKTTCISRKSQIVKIGSQG